MKHKRVHGPAKKPFLQIVVAIHIWITVVSLFPNPVKSVSASDWYNRHSTDEKTVNCKRSAMGCYFITFSCDTLKYRLCSNGPGGRGWPYTSYIKMEESGGQGILAWFIEQHAVCCRVPNKWRLTRAQRKAKTKAQINAMKKRKSKRAKELSKAKKLDEDFRVSRLLEEVGGMRSTDSFELLLPMLYSELTSIKPPVQAKPHVIDFSLVQSTHNSISNVGSVWADYGLNLRNRYAPPIIEEKSTEVLKPRVFPPPKLSEDRKCLVTACMVPPQVTITRNYCYENEPMNAQGFLVLTKIEHCVDNYRRVTCCLHFAHLKGNMIAPELHTITFGREPSADVHTIKELQKWFYSGGNINGPSVYKLADFNTAVLINILHSATIGEYPWLIKRSTTDQEDSKMLTRSFFWNVHKLIREDPVRVKFNTDQVDSPLTFLFTGDENHLYPNTKFSEHEKIFRAFGKFMAISMSHLGFAFIGLARFSQDYIMTRSRESYKPRLCARDIFDKDERYPAEILQSWIEGYGQPTAENRQTLSMAFFNNTPAECKKNGYTEYWRPDEFTRDDAMERLKGYLQCHLMFNTNTNPRWYMRSEFCTSMPGSWLLNNKSEFDKAFPRLYSIQEILDRIQFQDLDLSRQKQFMEIIVRFSSKGESLWTSKLLLWWTDSAWIPDYGEQEDFKLCVIGVIGALEPIKILTDSATLRIANDFEMEEFEMELEKSINSWDPGYYDIF